MSNNSTRDPDGEVSANFPGIENARDMVASSSQAVLGSVDNLNDLWGRITGREAKLVDVLATAASAWETYYTLVTDLWRLPLGNRDAGRPGWAIFPIKEGEESPAPFTVPLSRSYDASTTTVHRTEIQKLGGGGFIPSDNYEAILVNKGRSLRVRLVNLRQIKPPVGDYIGLVTVPSATAPLAVVLVTIRGANESYGGLGLRTLQAPNRSAKKTAPKKAAPKKATRKKTSPKKTTPEA
jgi:hypothetical protein